jgi:hypothetical protein
MHLVHDERILENGKEFVDVPPGWEIAANCEAITRLCQFKWQCLGLALADGTMFRTSTGAGIRVKCGDGMDIAGMCSLCYAFVGARVLFKRA